MSWNKDLVLTPQALEGSLQRVTGDAPIPEATWYLAENESDALVFQFPTGSLAEVRYLSADLLLDGIHLAVFELLLQEGEEGPVFGLSFGLLNQCQARLRMPLEAVNQNRWRYEREAAWLKPICQKQRVDLRKVDRMRLRILRKGPLPVRWCMTPMTASAAEPPRLIEPILPKGVLLDELGQSALHEWAEQSRSPQDVITRLQAQLRAAPQQRWPANYSRWGGWREKRLEATGFFRTAWESKRWWLVDPEGYAFWSSGLDCVRVDTETPVNGLETAMAWLPDPEGEYQAMYSRHGSSQMANFLTANLIRAFGPEQWYEKWAQIALAELRRVGFNTVANWSDWQIASRAGLPYVRPLPNAYESLPRVYRDFPDVFHPDFPQIAEAFAEPLRETKDDPALIGYFLMNEPTWGFAQETPAAGMLFNTPACASRLALADFLRQRYPSELALAAGWGVPVTYRAVAEGEWKLPLTETAQSDLSDFSEIMVEKFFGGLSAACKAADPNHLNLGIRYYTVPPAWALKGMRNFDVFSMNCYRPRLPAEEMGQISALLDLPILIGEWHFGALDAGLPASGIGHVPDQKSRGQAFRLYLDDAAAKPWCVGTHYFILYDQPATGRFDGENYNIGFLDVCNRPYEALCTAARQSHERLYEVAAGQLSPYEDAPEYLPLMFL